MILIIFLSTILVVWLALFHFIDRNTGERKQSNHSRQNASIDIIVAARNEAQNLRKLVDSIHKCTHRSNLRLIIADDQSTDSTESLVEQLMSDFKGRLNIDYFQLSGEAKGKKAAIELALERVSAEWIFFTDADCELQPDTLSLLLEKTGSQNSKVVFGPVIYLENGSLFQRLQHFENLNTLHITEAFLRIGKPIMANAANILLHKSKIEQYRKSLTTNHPGGDDVFFAHSLKSGEFTFCFEKHAAVKTNVETGFPELLKQRIRWASKTTDYNSILSKGLAAFVFLVSFIQVSATLAVFVFPTMAIQLIVFLFLKWAIEYNYQFHWFRRFGSHFNPMISLNLSLVYPMFVILVGIASVLRLNFEWKSRHYSSRSNAYHLRSTE